MLLSYDNPKSINHWRLFVLDVSPRILRLPNAVREVKLAIIFADLANVLGSHTTGLSLGLYEMIGSMKD